MTSSNATPLLTEEQEDATPVLLPVFEGINAKGATLYIGNRVAAADGRLLLRHGITSTMNLAVNIEMPPLVLPDGTHVRRTQIGLIDGPGNVPQHLLAAVLALHGMAEQASPGKSHYPAHRSGNVLVHCRGGRSRSATVITLYLHLFHRAGFPTFDEALRHVRKIRGLDRTQPQPAMLDLAGNVLELLAVDRLDPRSTRRP
ncbi:dual specificity protein phosphatase family protein [Shinella pollutisoli]|uniref:Dual specificity protein phosphatase family protein n=1 Tax=Shinella pollutisoli TaxID=2250594 RepID=A0ABV7DF24_9HYPH|nr:dual specificity protein phosphatase [Shinella pollutisoli]